MTRLGPSDTWLQLRGNEKDCSVVHTACLRNIVESLPEPNLQYPSLLFFLGNKSKQEALRHLFPNNHFKRQKPEGIARLRTDNDTLRHRNPVLIADAELTCGRLPEPHKAPSRTMPDSDGETCSVRWPFTDTSTVLDHVFARVIIASSNILIVFANDFASFDELIESLSRWINVGVRCSSPSETRPRLLIVAKGLAWSPQKRRDLYGGLESRRLTEMFSLVSTIYLPATSLSSTAAYQPLRDEIKRQNDEVRHSASTASWLFSASHFNALFDLRLRHTTNSRDDFMILPAVRKYHRSLVDLPKYMAEAIEYGLSRTISYQSIASYIASALLMDAYPSKSHLFPPEYVFRSLYESACSDAVSSIYSSQTLPRFFCGEVAKYFSEYWTTLKRTRLLAADLHRENIQSMRSTWQFFRSNATCVLCLRQPPDHVQSCQHALCDTCVLTFGKPCEGGDSNYRIQSCPLCSDKNLLQVRLKPPTAGVRILSIDGGGTRGVIPLEFLKLLQATLGSSCELSQFFDLAVGTSSGGLIVLIMFLYGWSTDKSSDTFETFARRLFSNGRSKEGFKFRDYVQWWVSDGKYERKEIEASFKGIFGELKTMFGSQNGGKSGMKVAVTAASTCANPKGFLLTNYNAAIARPNHIGYSAPPHGSPYHEARVWECARATTAAPGLFPPIEITSHGQEYQDGAMRFNNPVDPATSESRYIWPNKTIHDVVVSIGTGTVEDRSSLNQSGSKRPRIFDRLNHNFLTRIVQGVQSSFDGERPWISYRNRTPTEHQSQEFRLNINMDNAPAIDDVKCIPGFRSSVCAQPGGAAMRTDLAATLLTSSFYFRLESMPSFENGFLRCQGSICCRSPAPAVVKQLQHLCGEDLDFVLNDGYLGDMNDDLAICWRCGRFSKKITFYVRSLCETVIIDVKSTLQPRRRISGFPQSMQWFVEQQRLDASFGAPASGDGTARTCLSCPRSLIKRKRSHAGQIVEKRSRR